MKKTSIYTWCHQKLQENTRDNWMKPTNRKEQGWMPREHIIALLLPSQNMYLIFIRNVMPCGKGQNIYSMRMESGARKKTLGKNTLAIIMTNISRKANLSKHDTNQCVRATCITVLSEACFEARQIVTACLFYGFWNWKSLSVKEERDKYIRCNLTNISRSGG